MSEEKMDRKELTDKKLEKVTGGMGADLEKQGLAILGGAVAVPGGGASQLLGGDLPGISPRSEPVANPLSLHDNVDTLNRPPVPPSPVAESVKNAVDASLQNW